MQAKYGKCKQERGLAEKELGRCKRQLKKIAEEFSHTKAKEQQEMQLLSEMLNFTVSPRQQQHSN
jgi:hypothetical protein